MNKKGTDKERMCACFKHGDGVQGEGGAEEAEGRR